VGPCRGARSTRENSRRYSGELYEGHLGFSPPKAEPDSNGQRVRDISLAKYHLSCQCT
jgi:hypothetical protein